MSPVITTLKTGMEFIFGVLTRTDNMIQALWPLLVGVLIILLVALLFSRVVKEAQDYRLEFDKLENGTGDATLNDASARPGSPGS